MKRTIKLNKRELNNIIAESVRRTLKEWNNDYEGNDLDYDSIQMQAMSLIPKMEQSGQEISWRSVAEQMGFRLETLNGDDMELLKDAIEDVMYEDEVGPHWKEDMEFENDFQNLPYANESREKANKLTNKILAEVTRRLKGNKKLNEQQGSGLWTEIRFVQGGDDDYEEISQMFCGDNDAYCEANAQPVIDYLKQWDTGECEITPNQPRIARNDTSYDDENGEYTLLYNSSIGGDFLLYRPANEQEISWYMDNGTGSLNESANTRYKGFKCVNTSNNPSFPTYAIISPKGEQIGTTLFPSEMKEIVDEYLNGN